jgi:hypothetical protein
MKNCLACGCANADSASRCQACDTKTFVSSSPEAVGGHIISPDEKTFWERIGFSQFAVIFIRVEALWFVFNALNLVTYLPSYLRVSGGVVSPADGFEQRAYFFLFRIACNIAAALVCFRYASNIAHWLINKLPMSTLPPSGSDQR